MDPTHLLASIFPKLTQLTFPSALWSLSRDTLRALPVRFSGFLGYPPYVGPPSRGLYSPAIARLTPLTMVETGDPSAAADIALLRVRIQGLADGERITLGNIF